MKKKIFNFLAIVSIATMLSNCATVFGGRVTECQRTKPAVGKPTRELLRWVLVADILLFWSEAIIDFATEAIYKPCDNE